MVNENELRVIHYTLGPLKPWDWWTSWLLKPVDVWQNVREQLHESLPGTGGGKNPNDAAVVNFLFLVPFIAICACYYRSLSQVRDLFGSFSRSSLCDHARHLYFKFKSGSTIAYTAASSSRVNSNQQFLSSVHPKVPVYLGGASIFMCFIAALTSIGAALAIVPRQVMPWTGLLLMYEWTFAIFFLLFGGYLHFIYLWAKSTATRISISHLDSPDSDSEKGHHQKAGSSCDVAAWYYGFGMAFLAVVAPCLPFLFGITALFLRLGLMVAGGIILASFMTYASEQLAIRFFLRGLEDRDLPHTKNFGCFFC
ncbi:hypothetical protein QQ045_026294 [Rhodiola kirilowii]